MFSIIGLEKNNALHNRISYLKSYLKSLKSGIAYVFTHNYARIEIDLHDFLPLEKTLTLHNVIKLINPLQDGHFQ